MCVCVCVCVCLCVRMRLCFVRVRMDLGLCRHQRPCDGPCRSTPHVSALPTPVFASLFSVWWPSHPAALCHHLFSHTWSSHVGSPLLRRHPIHSFIHSHTRGRLVCCAAPMRLHTGGGGQVPRVCQVGDVARAQVVRRLVRLHQLGRDDAPQARHLQAQRRDGWDRWEGESRIDGH